MRGNLSQSLGLVFFHFLRICMSSPLLAASGSIAIYCLVLSDQQLIILLAKITSLCLMVRTPVWKFRRRYGYEKSSINKSESPYRQVPITADYQSRSGQHLRPTETLGYNHINSVVMAFRLAIILSFLTFFARVWSAPRAYSELPPIHRQVSRSSFFHSRTIMLSGSS
jgi:hypothetical protein